MAVFRNLSIPTKIGTLGRLQNEQINDFGNIITQDYSKHYYGCYGMPHVALGNPEPTQAILQVSLYGTGPKP